MATANEYLLKALMDSQEEDYEDSPLFMYGQRALMTPIPMQTRMSPWETLLTGALQGFGGGMLKGMGEAQIAEEQAKKAEAIAQLASATGDERYTLMEADPDLRKIAPIARMADAISEQEKKAAMALKLQEALLEAPKMRTITRGGTEIQEEFDPVNRTWNQVGAGPRWAPTAPGENASISEGAASVLAKAFMDRTGQQGPPDPNVIEALTNPKVATLLAGLENSKGVAERHKEDMARKEKQQIVSGYDNLPGAPVLGDTELKDLRETKSTTDQVIAIFDGIAKGSDPEDVFGNDAQLNQARASMLFNMFRGLTGSGAALSPSETEKLNAMIPRLAAGDLVGAVKAGMLDRDQKQFARDMQKLMQDSLDIQMMSYGKKSRTKDLSQYPAQTLAQMGIEAPDTAGGLGPIADALTAPVAPGQTTVPPGMRLLRNKVTGETKLVPK